MSWVDTYGAWAGAVETHPRQMANTRNEVVAQLDGVLADAGAVPVSAVQLKVTDQHSIPVRGLVIVLAEVRAIVLRQPNPFPHLRLFRRVR